MMHFRRDHRVSLDTNEISLYALCKQARPWHQSRDLCILFHYSSQRGLLTIVMQFYCLRRDNHFVVNVQSNHHLLILVRLETRSSYHLTIFYGPFWIDAVSSLENTFYGLTASYLRLFLLPLGYRKAQNASLFMRDLSIPKLELERRLQIEIGDNKGN